MSKLDEVLALFDNPKKVANGYMVVCPLHDDATPSLSITYDEVTDRILLKDFAGCDTRSILDWINGKDVSKVLSINKLRELARLPGKVEDPIIDKKLDKIFNYTDENNILIFQELRFINTYQSGKVKKDVRQRRPATREEKRDFDLDWVYSIKGCKRVIYNLPKVLSAKNEWILIPEGPSCASFLNELGFLATTNAMGATKWIADYNQYFEGKNVILLPDHDKIGYDHAFTIAKNLQPLVKDIKVIFLPGLEKKGDDIKDWFDNYGGSKIEFQGLIDNSLSIKDLDQNDLKRTFFFIEPIELLEDSNKVEEKVESDVFNEFLQELEKQTDACNDMMVGTCQYCFGSGYVMFIDTEGTLRIKTICEGEGVVLEKCSCNKPTLVLGIDQQDNTQFKF